MILILLFDFFEWSVCYDLISNDSFVPQILLLYRGFWYIGKVFPRAIQKLSPKAIEVTLFSESILTYVGVSFGISSPCPS